MKRLIWLILILGCDSPVAPEPAPPRLKACWAPDTVWTTVNGDSTFMVIPNCVGG